MIYIVRHGKTALNSARVMQGRIDCPLNEEGRKQAEEAARSLRENGVTFSFVFSSPLTRAVQTAEIIAGSKEMTTDERLLEMDYGPYEGSDLTNLSPELKRFFGDFVNEPAPEGMEPLESVTARMGSFLEGLRASAPDGNVLIVTHAIAIKGALEYLDPESRGSWWSRYVGNCDIFAFDITNGEYTVPARVNG